MQRAQQEGREAAHRAEAECQHHIDTLSAESKHWRKQAEGATGAARQAAVSLGQSRGVVEAMLTRLATAKSLAELADLSRFLFEANAPR